MGDDFEFRIDQAKAVDADRVRIPSMFVQILVENAFVHGLKGWDGHKSIHIEIDKKEKQPASRSRTMVLDLIFVA